MPDFHDLEADEGVCGGRRVCTIEARPGEKRSDERERAENGTI
jgi:hypothetical protein